MKKIVSLALLLAMMVAIFASCMGTTPDAAAEAATAITIDEVNFAIPVEIDGGESTTYTIEQAKAHELTKIYASYRYGGEDSWSGPQVTTAIFEGVKIKEFLADIGCPNATGLTVYHSDSEWYKEPFEYSAELIQEDGSLIAWIQNKTEIVKNSTTFVALVCENGGVNDMCSSIAKIVVHQ